MDDREEVEDLIIEFVLSIPLVIFMWLFLISFTFLFVDEISYTIGFWVYGILSFLAGFILTQYIIYKAKKNNRC